MRDFTDAGGNRWTASVREEQGTDYKGRFYLVLAPSAEPAETVALDDIRWNSERTARRTLETMSDGELRRRLRSALGRSRSLRS